ncbi:hypothetical protein A2U01_0109987, partial [Trifolium medium]|nr:hypothetical protein [Trifolium medium]
MLVLLTVKLTSLKNGLISFLLGVMMK